MGSSSRSCSSPYLQQPLFVRPSIALLLLHLAALLSLPLFLAQDSTGWPLSEYYNSSDVKSHYMYSNFMMCNNGNSDLVLLNDDQGLYAKCTDIRSAHYSLDYTVYFRLCFVVRSVAEDGVCIGSNATYHLSLIAFNYLDFGPDENKGQIIWTANTDNPVSAKSCLQLENDNNLKLVDYGNSSSSPEVVWESNTKRTDTKASLAITFGGSLVLFGDNITDPPFEPLWFSHQQPTDTLMVLQVLQKTSTLRFHNSEYSQPPHAGNYTMVIEDGYLKLYALLGQVREQMPYGTPYRVWPDSSSSVDHASERREIQFVALCWDPGSPNQLQLSAGYDGLDGITHIPPPMCSSLLRGGNAEQIIDMREIEAITYATFMRLEANGDFRAYTLDPETWFGWKSFHSVFRNRPCQLPLHCGFYGKCNGQKIETQCTCDEGFEFIDTSNVNHGLGCKLESGDLPTNGSVCGSTQKIMFLTLANVHYFSVNFTEPQNNKSDIRECQNSCQQDCNCTAAFWDPSGACFLIRGKVGTIQNGTMLAFIKYLSDETTPIATSISAQPPKEMGPVLGAAAAGLLATLVIACIFLYKRRRTQKKRLAELEKERLLLSVMDGNHPERFTWKLMHEYTCGFCDVLGGGGFGRVFRGSLPDGTAIAVKQLEEDRSGDHGDMQFIAEVSILSRIHHAHLVRLIGFCLEAAHRLLVYEFMENGSLDSWLFISHEDVMRRKVVLPWKTRFQIALGTSKGLAYLHEECEERVIHMDLKPQNILLGRDFSPKISDFGMSRRINREQSAVMTLMRGTPGYLAPEWLLDCAVTVKSDVYSFGIVLLEMVSGRKVRDLRELKQKLSMRSLRESVMMHAGLLDENLKYYGYDDELEEKEVVRMVEVALLCVRTDPAKRPTMSSVALMLEGKAEVEQTATAEDDDDYGYGDEDHGLIMYPSSRDRTMRSGNSTASLTMSFDMMQSSSSHYQSSHYSFKKKQQQQQQGLHMGNNSKKKKKKKHISRSMEFDGSLESDALLNDSL